MITYKGYFIPGLTEYETLDDAKAACDDVGEGTYGIIEVTFEAEETPPPLFGTFSMTGAVSYTVRDGGGGGGGGDES